MDIVNRETELAIAEELMAEVARETRTPEQCILEFVGIAGSGKSILLRKAREISLEYKLSVHHLDFAGRQYQDATAERAAFLLAQDLFNQADFDLRTTSTLQGLVNTYLDTAGEQLPAKVEELLRQLAIAFSSGSRHGTIVILDSMDRLPDSVLVLVERLLIVPWLERRHQAPFALIIASRYPLQWQNHISKEAIQLVELAPFSVEGTLSQVQDTVGPDIAIQIHETTGGLPLLNSYAAKRIQEIPSVSH